MRKKGTGFEFPPRNPLPTKPLRAEICCLSPFFSRDIPGDCPQPRPSNQSRLVPKISSVEDDAKNRLPVSARHRSHCFRPPAPGLLPRSPAGARAPSRHPPRTPQLHPPVGKSTVIAINAVHHAFTQSKRLVVVCSPSRRPIARILPESPRVFARTLRDQARRTTYGSSG